MSIAWRDAMSIGDESIDDDHKRLIARINTFEQAVADGIDHKTVARVLLALADETAAHFTREEELQKAIRYPYYESHRRSHREFLAKLQEIAGAYAVSVPGAARDGIVNNLSAFLKDLLVEHLIQSDLRMKPYVLQLKRSQAEAIRKRRQAIALSEKMAGMEVVG
jgi:hemerythrin